LLQRKEPGLGQQHNTAVIATPLTAQKGKRMTGKNRLIAAVASLVFL
jgi:hypothetical protein